MMTDREKIQTQIEARFRQFGQTISELKIKTEQRQDKFNGQMKQTLDDIENQHEKVRQRLQTMSSIGDADWSATETDVSKYLDDIDAGLRRALSHYK
ncbi:MAG: hypothetical protein HF981_02085 [Desulfobacteraceae bacterium]|nr:hypothetical protein [Desulfobacteraceae bacterium]MBC2749152.1 hypothetical protein [Desulfobacteraceae bacterium]